MKILSVLIVIFLYLEIFSQQSTGQSSFPIACPNGMILYNGFCYNISNDKATWNEANANCVSNGGRLARILNGGISYGIQRIVNNTDGTENYWIGLQRVGNSEQFQWTDGTNLTYNKWNNSNPILGYNCVGVKRNIWFSLNCINSYFYICETDVCNGWRVRNGICYKKFKEEASIDWNGAETLCKDKNAYLAEIPNILVNDNTNQVIRRDECWIGLRTNETDYYWRIGNFPLSDPNTVISQNNTDMCGTIGVNKGDRWGLKDCINSLSCAVCMKGPLTIEYPTFRCRNTRSVIVNKGICYRRIIRRANELDLASLTCNRLNGELYRFDDNELNRTLMDIFTSRFLYSRYPILAPDEYNQFVPQDGYFNLLTSNENLITPTMCHQLSSSAELVQADRGGNIIHYICKIEYDPFEYVQQTVSTKDSCYWSVSGNRNWTEADTQCSTEGGHLVEIFNKNTQNIIVSLITTDNQYLDELYWIGIEYVSSSPQWRSGANVTYSNFSSDTAITDFDLRCVAIDKDGSWRIMDCNNKYSFVCGKIVTGGDYSPCNPPTTQSDLSFDWFNCDRLYNSVCLTKSLMCANWAIANDACVQNSGRFADYEYSWVKGIPIGTDNYWTGWRRVGNTSEFQNTDGSGIYGFKWENNNPIDGINCVGYEKQGGLLVSLNCSTENTYICRIENNVCIKRKDGYRDICSSLKTQTGILTESSLKNLSLDFNLETVGFIQYYTYKNYIIILRLWPEFEIQIPISTSTIKIAKDTFKEVTSLVFHRTDNTRVCDTNSFSFDSIISIYASSNSTGKLSISFVDYDRYNEEKWCVYLSSDGCEDSDGSSSWSSEGLSTYIQYEGLSTSIQNSYPQTVHCIGDIQGTATIGVYAVINPPTAVIRYKERSVSKIKIQCRTSDTYCYTINDVKANWSIANDSCVQQGGKLITVKDETVNSQINMLIRANNGTENYWTGWKRVGDNETFHNTNGYNLPDWYGWKHNNKDGMNCVGTEGESGLLVSLKCNTEHPFVCAIDLGKCDPPETIYQSFCSSSIFNYEIPIEKTLRDLNLNYDMETDDILKFSKFNDSKQELVVKQVSPNIPTLIQMDENILHIKTDTEVKVSVMSRPCTYNKELENASFILRSDIITIYKSESSTANLNISFNSKYSLNHQCVYLRSDKYWSTEGMTTFLCKSNASIKCTAELRNFITIAVGGNYNSVIPDNSTFYVTFVLLGVLVIIFSIISFISLVLLLSSVVIFIISGRNFFSHDINVLHFNNTLALSLAIISTLSIAIAFVSPDMCIAVKSFLQFMWTNVFISSLSIAILVLYSIWIVSMQHTARKLYKYLIPIGWCVSFLWGVGCFAYDMANREQNDCDSPLNCMLMNQSQLNISWPFLGIMIGILLINIVVLILSLIKIWFAFKRQNNQEGELNRLRRVAFGGILLIPALSFPFITLIVIKLFPASESDPVSFENLISIQQNLLICLIIIIINSPIGIVHFILITCQIKETVIREYCFCKSRFKKTLPKLAHSLHLNVVRKPRTKQQTNENVIQEPVSINDESTLYSAECTESTN